MIDKFLPHPKERIVYRTYPSDRLWTDGELITRICQYTWQDVTTVGAVQTLVAPNNPKRVAVGFVSSQAPGVIEIAPYSDGNASGFIFGFASTTVTWFHLHTYYSLVTAEWYAFSAMGLPLRVIQIERV